MYKLYAFFTNADGIGRSEKKISIGFKTVELVQEFVSGDPKQGRVVNHLIGEISSMVQGKPPERGDPKQGTVVNHLIGEIPSMIQ